jgi:hypothetical protein
VGLITAPEAPGYDHRRERGWTRVGEDGIFSYLSYCPEGDTALYRNTHPLQLLYFPALDLPQPLSIAADTHMSAADTADSHESVVGLSSMEVEAMVHTAAPHLLVTESAESSRAPETNFEPSPLANPPPTR